MLSTACSLDDNWKSGNHVKRVIPTGEEVSQVACDFTGGIIASSHWISRSESFTACMCVSVTDERDTYQSNLFFRLIRQDERDPLVGYDDERMQDQNQRSHQSPYLGAGYSGLDIYLLNKLLCRLILPTNY